MLPKGTCRSAVVIAFCRSLFSLEKNTIYIVSAKRVDVPCTWRVQILHRKHCCNRNDLKKPPWRKRWFSSQLYPRQLTFISKNDALEKLATQRYPIFDIYSSNFWGASLVTPWMGFFLITKVHRSHRHHQKWSVQHPTSLKPRFLILREKASQQECVLEKYLTVWLN